MGLRDVPVADPALHGVQGQAGQGEPRDPRVPARAEVDGPEGQRVGRQARARDPGKLQVSCTAAESIDPAYGAATTGGGAQLPSSTSAFGT